MTVCPNCNHSNPEGATQCEACYTPLPSMMDCPSCGTPVQTDATFCGECGFNLQPNTLNPEPSKETALDIPPIPVPPVAGAEPETRQIPPTIASVAPSASLKSEPSPLSISPNSPSVAPVSPSSAPIFSGAAAAEGATRLQIQRASLLHTQTGTALELPQGLSVIHIGKPNEQVPPDIDISGFSNAEIVSRIHADIRVEGDGFYLEDVGSANGTYVNHIPLLKGNRHRLRAGDRIALGKGDLMTLIFQLS